MIHPSDGIGRRVFWLLDLAYAGLNLRLSDGELDVVKEDGTSLHYIGALDRIEVNAGIDFLSDASTSPTSAAIDVLMPVDVARMVAQGHDIAGSIGTLSRWVEGEDWEERQVLIWGVVVNPEYGADHEATSFSLELTPWTDSKVIPAPGLAVEGANWDAAMIASLPSSGLGLAGPVVVGNPGRVSTSVYSSGLISGSQPVWVDQRKNIHTSGGHFREVTPVVAYHHVTAQSIYLKTDAAPTPLRYKVVNTHDRAGHPVAVATWWHTVTPSTTDVFDYDGSASYNWNQPTASTVGCIGHVAAPASIQPGSGDTPSPIFATWVDADDATRGGLAGRDGKAMRAAGDVLEWLLRQSGIPVDHGRFAAARPLLSRFLLDFTIDAQVSPWEFAQANLIPILPVSIVNGPKGLAPIVWRYTATSKDAVCHLDTGIDPYIQRASRVSYDRQNIRNDITLNYAYSVRSGNFVGSLRYAATDADGATPSYPCRLSQLRYRRPDGAPLAVPYTTDSIVIYDDSTAHAVCQWMARAYALARRRVEYLLPEGAYGWLSRGYVVTITDAEMYFASQVCLVESVRVNGGPLVLVTLLLVEEPVRDARLVG